MLQHEGRAEVVRIMKELFRVVGNLNEVYEKHNLNEFQPDSMETCLPASIDEWHSMIAGCIHDWEKVPVSPSRGQILAKEMERLHPEYNGWKFDYMFPGYFSFCNDEFRVFFTPDHDTQGELSREVQNLDGESIVSPHGFSPCLWANHEYADPLTVEELFKVAKEMMDHCDIYEVKTKLRETVAYLKTNKKNNCGLHKIK